MHKEILEGYQKKKIRNITYLRHTEWVSLQMRTRMGRRFSM